MVKCLVKEIQFVQTVQLKIGVLIAVLGGFVVVIVAVVAVVVAMVAVVNVAIIVAVVVVIIVVVGLLHCREKNESIKCVQFVSREVVHVVHGLDLPQGSALGSGLNLVLEGTYLE